MSRRVLHILAQRPGLTGSGVTLDALVTRARRAGWEQRVVAAAPVGQPELAVGGLPASDLRPLLFESQRLPFPIPGMSDVMPYPSRRYSAMTETELGAYRRAWTEQIAAAIAEFRPEVIHVHHLWLVAAMAGEIAGDIPVVIHCHGTGLRQMALCPELGAEVRRRCSVGHRFLALHQLQGRQIVDALGVDPSAVVVVGAGYRDSVFHSEGRSSASERLVYAGKLSRAKGLPWLLDSVEQIARHRSLHLDIAGGGSGDEADRLRRRIASMAPLVIARGQLDQVALAARLRDAAVFVLPSMYEGLPLVVIEAAACGCRPVCTDLPGVRELGLDGLIELVELPRLSGPDEPIEADLPGFVISLSAALERALDAGPIAEADLTERLARFTWDAVFERVERVWLDAIG